MAVITKQQLLDASADAETFEQVTNGPESLTVTSRLNRPIDTVAKAIASLKAFNPRGAWVTATAYALKDVVVVSDVLYVATVAHTSAASFNTDLTAERWAIYQGSSPATELQLSSIGRVIGNGTDQTAEIQDAIDNFFTVELTGDITVSGGPNLFYLKDDQRLTGTAVITHNTTNEVTFLIDGVSNVTIDGSIKVKGSGKALGTACALYVRAANNVTVNNFDGEDISGWHIKIDPGAFVSPRGDTGAFSNSQALNCWYSLEGTPGTGAEYFDFTAYSSAGCEYGPIVSCGNWRFTGGCDEGNAYGFTLLSGSNNSHGNITCRAFNHCTNWLFRANGASLGEPLTNCSFYGDSPTAGKIIIENSNSISITNSLIDAAIEVASPTGPITINNNTLTGANASIACNDWSLLEFSNNKNFTGNSPLNRPATGDIWVKFHWNGSAIVIDGASSTGFAINRNGTGDYTLVFPSEMPTDHYAVHVALKTNVSFHMGGFTIGDNDKTDLRVYTYTQVAGVTTQIDPLSVWVTVSL